MATTKNTTQFSDIGRFLAVENFRFQMKARLQSVEGLGCKIRGVGNLPYGQKIQTNYRFKGWPIFLGVGIQQHLRSEPDLPCQSPATSSGTMTRRRCDQGPVHAKFAMCRVVGRDRCHADQTHPQPGMQPICLHFFECAHCARLCGGTQPLRRRMQPTYRAGDREGRRSTETLGFVTRPSVLFGSENGTSKKNRK